MVKLVPQNAYRSPQPEKLLVNATCVKSKEGKTMSELRKVLVIGGRGVLGSTISKAFDKAGWSVICGSRRSGEAIDTVHVDLQDPATVTAAAEGIDLVINTVPDSQLVAEKVVLDRGGVLINVATISQSSVRSLRNRLARTPAPSGCVLFNGGLAPGVTNLVIADLLATHPDADTVELVMSLSSKGMSGREGVRFVHENITTGGRHGSYSGRHATEVIPLPAPIGKRKCFGFAEREGGWVGDIGIGRSVRTYAYIDSRPLHSTILALNPLRLLPRLPLTPFMSGHGKTPSDPTEEPINHWVSLLKDGRRIAASTVECGGDYFHAAAATVIMAEAFTAASQSRGRSGCFNPEDLFTLSELRHELEHAGIVIAEQSESLVVAS